MLYQLENGLTFADSQEKVCVRFTNLAPKEVANLKQTCN